MSRIVVIIHAVVFSLHRMRIPLLPNLLNRLLIRLLFGCQLGPGTVLGKEVALGYGGLGVVIHGKAVIGDRVNIGTGVTIGGTTKQDKVPIIGDDTLIATGAKVLGAITIGKGCVIGANAVVLTDIPDRCVAVGMPARIVKRNIDISDYR